MNERFGAERAESPEELRRDIERTRAEMSGTIDAIREKLDPEVLKAQAKEKLADAKDKVTNEVQGRVREAKHAVREATVGRMEDMVDRTKHGVRDAGGNVVDRIRENPIPAAMVGVGLAWLFFGGRKEERRELRPRHAYDYEDEYGYEGGGAYGVQAEHGADAHEADWKDEAKGRAREVRERAEGAVERVKGAASHTLERTQERARDASRRARHGASDLQHRARHQAQRIESGFERTFRDNPIAIGAAALAVGTVVGLSLPHTEREDETLGAARDKLVDRAQDLAHEGIEKAKSKAHEALPPGGAERGDGGEERPSFPSRPSIGSA